MKQQFIKILRREEIEDKRIVTESFGIGRLVGLYNLRLNIKSVLIQTHK